MKLVLFIYNINSIHTVHSWPFYGLDVVVCLMSFFFVVFSLFVVKKTQHFAQRVSLLKMSPIKDYISMTWVFFFFMFWVLLCQQWRSIFVFLHFGFCLAVFVWSSLLDWLVGFLKRMFVVCEFCVFVCLNG